MLHIVTYREAAYALTDSLWQSCEAQKFTKIRKKSDIAMKNSYPHGLFMWIFFRIFIGW